MIWSWSSIKYKPKSKVKFLIPCVQRTMAREPKFVLRLIRETFFPNIFEKRILWTIGNKSIPTEILTSSFIGPLHIMFFHVGK